MKDLFEIEETVFFLQKQLEEKQKHVSELQEVILAGGRLQNFACELADIVEEAVEAHGDIKLLEEHHDLTEVYHHFVSVLRELYNAFTTGDPENDRSDEVFK